MKTRWIWLAGVASIAGMCVLGIPASLTSQQTAPLRERLFQVPTAAVLDRLPNEPIERLTFPADDSLAALRSPWELDNETGAYYRPGELLVKFKEGVGSAAYAQALRNSGANRVAKALPERWQLIQLGDQTTEHAALAGMLDSGVVEDASLNYQATAFQRRPNDELFSLQWNFDALEMTAAWDINPGASPAVTVAVVDTGLNVLTDTLIFPTQFGQIPVRFSTVPDLAPSANAFRPYDFVWDDAFPFDFVGHGTHVAGTIAQTTNNTLGLAGLAYNVRLMPVKVLATLGSWDDFLYPCPVGFIRCHRGGSYEVIAEGIRYAADSGAQIINLSLGGPAAGPILRDAIRYAVARGAFVAIAAGNAGDRGNPTEYPAAYGSEIAGAMTVGAINRSLRPAVYSAFKPYVEICAPGGQTRGPYVDYEQGVSQITYRPDVTFADADLGNKLAALRLGFRPNFDTFIPLASEGTSMAAPHVAGIAALLYSQGITNPIAIEEAIKMFARQIDARPEECGAGLVDPRRALRGLGLAR